MARFYDRLVADGSHPVSAYDLMRMAESNHPDGHIETRRASALDLLARSDIHDSTEEQIERAMQAIRQRQREHRSTDSAASGWTTLAKAQVIIGDEVGHYLNSFPDGIQLSTLLLTPVVPPFGHVFVDFRRVDNPYSFDEFGFLLSTVDHGDDPPGGERWTIYASLYGSWDGRGQVGPIITAKVPLDTDGNLIRIPAEQVSAAPDLLERLANGVPMVSVHMGGDLHFESQLVGPFRNELMIQTTNMLYMALLTISFTHVKNVNVVEIDPDPKRSRAFRRRHGRGLHRHYVLDIGGTRNAIDEATRQTGSLVRAWHRCRGHFATYTSERPLFGRHTGTFWIPTHVRGNMLAGVVEKDYRTLTGAVGGVGSEWVDDDPDAAPSAHEGGSNPDLAGRGWRAHSATVNRLAAHLVAVGRSPRRPAPSGPQFDCAWSRTNDAGWAVAEVKSITDGNAAEQIRRGIGQLDYRHALAEVSGEHMTAVLVVERAPAERWVEVCAAADIVLVWPDNFDKLPT